MNDQEIETEQMRCALSAIANEVQNFHCESLASDETQNDVKSSTTLLKYKNALQGKKEQVEMLRHNLKSACTVAKTLSAAKAIETASLNNQLNCARNQYCDLMKEEKEKTNIINTLRAENQTLQDKLQCFNNFIHLGYQDLQNIHSDSSENISSLKQLQTIICCCGQYYSDLHCQFEKCAQLEQKNRFLNSKLRILESQLETALEELRNLRTNTKQIQREKGETPAKKFRNIGVVCSEYIIGHQSNVTDLKLTKIEFNKTLSRDNNKNYCNLDLTRHLSTVRKLLQDQDSLIKDLKCISKEINAETLMG